MNSRKTFSGLSGFGSFLKWGALAGVFLILLVTFALVQPERLDSNLCPEIGARDARTILLVDTSDPLTAKHRSELARLLAELRTPPASGAITHFYVKPGEELFVYELTNDLEAIDPIVRVCNPGDNPSEWDWHDDLTRGKRFAIRNWQEFEGAIEGLFSDSKTLERTQSKILENIAVILPRHTRSTFQVDLASTPRTHLIVFSDLLQNSGALSHYAPFGSTRYPSTEDFTSKGVLRELSTDLTGVRVSLLRLERSEYATFQTKTHYNWWANFIVKTGGTLHYQSSI